MPFAGYSSFDDCLKKNSDKKNASAYCGYIMHKVEGNVKDTEAIGQWNKMSESQQASLQDMFDKERHEHPDFPEHLIHKIVDDHTKLGVEEKKQHPMTATTGPPVAADSGAPLQRYWPPSEISPQQTGDGRVYTAPGSNPKLEKVKERFRWLAPFKIIKDAATRKLKGDAINVGKSRNKVPYTADELMRGGRTLAGKPLLHNHLESIQEAQAYLKGMHVDGSTFDPATIPDLVRKNIETMISRGDIHVGKVLDAEYEDQAVEYVARVETPEAVAMVDADLVKGVSIGAVPRNQSLTNPQGIMFADLSIITDPETPGDPDATAKVMEKLREYLRPVSVSWDAPINEMHNRVLTEMNQRIQVTTNQREQLQREVSL